LNVQVAKHPSEELTKDRALNKQSNEKTA